MISKHQDQLVRRHRHTGVSILGIVVIYSDVKY